MIPGATLLVARHGKIAWFESMGVRDPGNRAPMSKDAIFRIYSMSKPITSVAVLMLVEEGKIALADPVSKYIPQLGGLKVGVEKPGANGARRSSSSPRGARSPCRICCATRPVSPTASSDPAS